MFVAGATIQWLRDGLQIVEDAAQSEAAAISVPDTGGVYLVPAFTGLGAPYWDPYARGAILGLSRGSGRNQIVTATLQAIAYQTRDLIDAMREDGIAPSVIRVDGGMVANNWFLQFLADILGIPVERPENVESTALGATYLAGLCAGIFDSTQSVADKWRSDQLFEPSMQDDRREQLMNGWSDAVRRVGGHA